MQRLREYIQDELIAITASEITRMLKTRFQIEQFSQYFSIRPYHFSGSAISMSADENILLEFPTLKSDYPQYYQSSHYRMLLVLSIADVVDFNATVLQDIDHIAQGENIDQIVIWTRRNLDRSVSDVLKHHRATVIKIADSELSEVDQLTNFVFNAGVDSDKLIALNFIADLLVKRLKKLFHFVLSEIAAPIYDLKYGKAKVATNRLMKREEAELRHIVDLVAPEPTETGQSSSTTRIAVDVGCGTGRHSFDLAKRFSKVYAFDFSSRMIDQAREKKKGLDNRNIVFSTADLEYEEVDGEQDFSGNADLVVASFGMASFVENTSRMLRRFYTWLKPGGRLFLSFYNANSVLDVMTPNWRDTSLSAHLDKQRRTLREPLNNPPIMAC